jgi:hypothetical protein
MAIAIIVWLVTAKVHMGAITVDTLSDQWVSFAGNSAAIISGGILSIGLSLWRPANFDWEKTRNMEVVEEDLLSSSSSVSSSSPNQPGNEKSDEKSSAVDVEVAPASKDSTAVDGLDIPGLERTFKKYTIVFAIMAVIITLVSNLRVLLTHSL